MQDWTGGYVTEIAYTHGFYRDLTPQYLRFVALTCGVDLPEGIEHGRYCELGCGQGITANLVASAYPGWDVVATDFNANQILFARGLARAAGSDNVRFDDASFESFRADRTTGEFDVIVAHGIWSWVDPANREHVLDFIRERLRPGGLFYVSYNAQPGWSPVLPLRQLLVNYANSLRPKPLSTRIRSALDFAVRAQQAGARIFVNNPLAGKQLARLQTMSTAYLAHEFFNENWAQFSFSEVAADMRRARLEYVGTAGLLDRLDVMNLTAAQSELLSEFEDPVGRETMRDLFVDQRFRRDVFARGPLRLAPRTAQARLLALSFALTVAPSAIPMKLTAGLGEITLKHEIYRPLAAAFAAGPRRLDSLQQDPALAGISTEQIVQAVIVLVGLDYLTPCLPSAGLEMRHTRTTAYNAALAALAREATEIGILASPVLGSGVPADRLSHLLLAAENEGTEPVTAVWRVLRAEGCKLTREGKLLDSDDDNLAELTRIYGELQAGRFPIIRQLRLI